MRTLTMLVLWLAFAASCWIVGLVGWLVRCCTGGFGVGYLWHRAWILASRCLCACRRLHPLWEDPTVFQIRRLPPHAPLRLFQGLGSIDIPSTFRLGGNRHV